MLCKQLNSRTISLPKLLQARATETFQIVLPLGVELDRHLPFDPGKRNVGLRAAKLPRCDTGDISLAGHARGGRQHSVGADEIAALSDSFARKPYRLVVIAPAELCVSGDPVVDRRKRVAWTEPQCTACSRVGLFPAPAIGQRQAVITLGERE